MKSNAQSAFQRQFGYRKANEQASDKSGPKDTSKKENNKKKAPTRKKVCSCNCPDCGVPEKPEKPPAKSGSIEEEDEKSTIGDYLLKDYFSEDQGISTTSTEPDRAVKMKTFRSTTVVECPKCHTRLHVQMGTGGVEQPEDEESISETDSLYEIKDAYDDWSWSGP